MHAGRTQRVLDRNRLRDHAERSSVLGRCRKDEIGRLEAAGTRHVLGHHRRIAGDMPADETGKQPAVIVVRATRRKTDVEIDDLAFEELFGALPMSAGRNRDQ